MAKLPDDILTLRAAQREIAAERSFASPLLERYVVSAGRGFAGHLSSSNNGGSGTAAAFCALFLARSARAGYLAASEELLSSLTHQVRQTCLPALAKLAHGALADRADKTGLNNYKLPIYVAGVAALANLNLIESAEALTGIELGLKEIHERLNRDTAGALSRVGEYARKEPSAYHSYWAALALTESLSSSAVREKLTKDQGELRHLVSDLGLVRLWAEGALAALVADEHAGITSRFDPIELVCAASLTLLDRCDLAAPGHKPLILPPPSAEAVRLASHGLEILFNRHFSGGSLARSKPVYSDENRNPIFCSTAEALFYMLLPPSVTAAPIGAQSGRAAGGLHARPHVKSLLEAFDLVRRSRTDDGYLPDLDGAFGIEPRANAFSTFASVCFLLSAEACIDDMLDQLAREELQVPAYANDEEIRMRRYPQTLGDVLEHYVIDPLRKGDRRRAYYSMIFHGPPGTAKTTLAKKLAQDLEWPFVEISQRDFLVEGTAYIDAAADRIFSLVGLLKDVVVLFDELEEMIASRENTDSDRESRLLTTSMLPRLHDLRDKRRIVFIFATNRIRQFDKAATRPGRFDIIQLVPPPSADELKTYLKELCNKKLPDKTGAQSTARRHALSIALNVGMTYKDIALFVDELHRRCVRGMKLSKGDVKRIADDFTSVEQAELQRFNELSKQNDRPRGND